MERSQKSLKNADGVTKVALRLQRYQFGPCRRHSYLGLGQKQLTPHQQRQLNSPQSSSPSTALFSLTCTVSPPEGGNNSKEVEPTSRSRVFVSNTRFWKYKFGHQEQNLPLFSFPVLILAPPLALIMNWKASVDCFSEGHIYTASRKHYQGFLLNILSTMLTCFYKRRQTLRSAAAAPPCSPGTSSTHPQLLWLFLTVQWQC